MVAQFVGQKLITLIRCGVDMSEDHPKCQKGLRHLLWPQRPFFQINPYIEDITWPRADTKFLLER